VCLSSSRPLFFKANFGVSTEGVCAFRESGEIEDNISNRIPAGRALEKIFFKAYLSIVKANE
jgi:hypothetical protein